MRRPPSNPVVLGFFLCVLHCCCANDNRSEILRVLGAAESDGTSPEQVHLSAVGKNKMRVAWITSGDAPAIVYYGTSPGGYHSSQTGTTSTYHYVFYKSGKLHNVVIGPLRPGTVYYYRCSSKSGRELSFRTPPARLPMKFVVVGDLGQTERTKTTLGRIEASDHDMLLLGGDLSYADYYQPRWDSFGRLVEPLASRRPWMVTAGNHEIEWIPLLESTSFKAYNARWKMPHEESGSASNLYYSFDAAGGAVHVLMLGSYTDFAPGSEQHSWLVADLRKVAAGRRRKTPSPWVVALVHAPWYNSNKAHKGEGEDMRKAMERVLYDAGVDIVFAGHVHAYERFERVFDNRADECGAVHITVGGGGNREGLATQYVDLQPSVSVFREASFGHGRLQVVNDTHAYWTWHRNDDGDVAAPADAAWLTSLSSNPACL